MTNIKESDWLFLTQDPDRRIKTSVDRKLESLGVWIGKDMRSATDLVIPPDAEQHVLPVTVDDESFPPINFQTDDFDEILTRLQVSVRSRGAQLGLTMDLVYHFPESFSFPQSTIQRKKISLGLGFYNLGARPVGIKQGEGVACLASIKSSPEAAFIKGPALDQAVKDGRIGITKGEYGRDWSWYGYGLHKKEGGKESTVRVLLEKSSLEFASGMAVRLSDQRYEIAPADNPIYVFDEKIKDFRELIKKNILPLAGRAHGRFWLARTAIPLYLDPSVCGFLHPDLKVGHTERNIQIFGHQTASRLIKGGETNWPIIVEAHTPDLKGRIKYHDMWAFFSFFKKGPLATS